MNRSIIGIIIAAITIGFFVLALINPNLQENDETWFGFINVNSDQSNPIQESQSNFATAPATKDICDSSYPDICIPPYPPDMDCGEIQFSNFRVYQPDPHGLDTDYDGIGCES